jgi:hypothetical protein
MAADPPPEINLEEILANLLVPDNAVIKQVIKMRAQGRPLIDWDIISCLLLP